MKFQKPEFAKRALQLNGTRISDRIMIGVKPLVGEGRRRYIGGVCDDVDDFGSNKRNSIDRSPRGGGNKRTMLNGSASVALQPRRGTWNKVAEFVFALDFFPFKYTHIVINKIQIRAYAFKERAYIAIIFKTKILLLACKSISLSSPNQPSFKKTRDTCLLKSNGS